MLNQLRPLRLDVPLLPQMPERVPVLREIAGQKQHDQNANEFDRLEEEQVHLGVAPSRPAAKDAQRDGQQQGRYERHVTELLNCRS